MKTRLVKCILFATLFFMIACTTKKEALQPSMMVSPWSADNYKGSYTKITDIINTQLDLTFNWDSAFVMGKANILAKPYFYPLSQVTLDARGFRLKEVSLIKKDEHIPLKYSYDNMKLIIELDKTYTRDQKFTLFIDYTAMPYSIKVNRTDDRGIYFTNFEGKDKNKPKQIWTQGETEYNSSWFPTINGPQEKMTQEINITVPNEYVTLSNGTMEYSSLNGDGTRTDSWRQEQPHSTYLAMVAAGRFTITKDTWNDKEVSYYTEPKYASTARLIFGNTPEMLEFYSKKLGVDYPWDKYSQMVVRDFVSGAMENTSATILFDRMNMTEGQYLDASNEEYIAHELFHQWFGDLVTAESWSNLPLNESFATYGEYLWMEHKYGKDKADEHGQEDLQIYLRSAKNHQLNVIRFNYPDKETMFDEVSYQKGARILHMLRKLLGDDAFFKSLNLYLTRNAYKTAEIQDLRMAFEEITGQDLNWFFTEWFMQSGHPVLEINSSYDADKKLVNLNIRQTQNLTKTPLYKIPLLVDIYGNGKKERKEIILEQQNQNFAFPCIYQPDLVNADAEKYIPGEKTENKNLAQYIFQYKNGPLYMDRYEALNAIKLHENEQSAREIMILALGDKTSSLRQWALDFVVNLNEEEKKSVYHKIAEMATKDEKSLVRASAIRVIKSIFSDYNNQEIFNKAKADKAESVIKALGNNAE